MGRKSTIRFRSDNQVFYGQDHSFHCGLPSGVDFTVERAGSVNETETLWRMVACGYGCLKRHDDRCYGNGALYVYSSRMSARTRKRLLEAERAPD